MTGEALKPSYLGLADSVLKARAAEAGELLKDCTLCPRECRVDRTEGGRGYCRTGGEAFVSSWGPHFGEEAPLVGRGGSGTIFFGNCNLGCIFCQNYSISHEGGGDEMSGEELAGVMLSLQASGCHNINLVTPTHQVPAIMGALCTARSRGLELPLVYNCGGYEALHALRLLHGIIDIYMPDFKYADEKYSAALSDAPDYPSVARAALREMHAQVGDLVVDAGGVARRGLLVRHLVLPGDRAGTAEVVRFIAEEISRDTYINIMDQYHPCYRAFDHPPLDRRITKEEYAAALQAAMDAELRRMDGINA